MQRINGSPHQLSEAVCSRFSDIPSETADPSPGRHCRAHHNAHHGGRRSSRGGFCLGVRAAALHSGSGGLCPGFRSISGRGAEPESGSVRCALGREVHRRHRADVSQEDRKEPGPADQPEACQPRPAVVVRQVPVAGPRQQLWRVPFAHERDGRHPTDRDRRAEQQPRRPSPFRTAQSAASADGDQRGSVPEHDVEQPPRIGRSQSLRYLAGLQSLCLPGSRGPRHADGADSLFIHPEQSPRRHPSSAGTGASASDGTDRARGLQGKLPQRRPRPVAGAPLLPVR